MVLAESHQAWVGHKLSHVLLFVTPWNAARRLHCPWNSPGKNIGVGCHSLLQGILPTQGLNPDLLYCRQILYHLSHLGSPKKFNKDFKKKKKTTPHIKQTKKILEAYLSTVKFPSTGFTLIAQYKKLRAGKFSCWWWSGRCLGRLLWLVMQKAKRTAKCFLENLQTFPY